MMLTDVQHLNNDATEMIADPRTQLQAAPNEIPV